MQGRPGLRARRIKPRASPHVAAMALALAVWLGACGADGDSERPAPQTRFAAALAAVRGTEPVGTGYGWIDVERLRGSGAGLRAQLSWAAEALGPGANDIARAGRSLRHLGVEPERADSLLSVATSYALGLRLDGVEPERVERALLSAGARRRAAEGATSFDLGPEWSSPLGSDLEPLGSFAARTATRPSTIVLARSELARGALISSSSPAIDANPLAVAADCLGDVVAARLVLNNHTHLPNVGPELLAFGVLAPGPGPRHEVLCAIGEPRGPVDAAARSLGVAFEPGKRDAVSGEPMRDLVASSEVEAFDEAGLRVARTELVTPPGTEPGLLFRAFNRGSLLTYMGLQPPPTPGPGS